MTGSAHSLDKEQSLQLEDLLTREEAKSEEKKKIVGEILDDIKKRFPETAKRYLEDYYCKHKAELTKQLTAKHKPPQAMRNNANRKRQKDKARKGQKHPKAQKE